MTDEDSIDEPGPDGDRTSASRRLARRAVASVMTLVRRGLALAGGLLMVTLLICGGGFLLGYAALSDGIQTVWIMIGGFFAVLGIGASALAIVRLLSVRTREEQLVDEITALIANDPQTERTVIETIEVNDASQDQGVVVMSREFSTMQQSFGGQLDNSPALRTSLSAVTSLPFLVFITMFVSMFFAGLSAIFALALLL
ncbi:MAG: hypothetical protein QNM02_01555 [Acidimicrobiia bacterium]|nr:hypothetical protein [Acidimicrobiia bacterium]